jgi:hypothetical protein
MDNLEKSYFVNTACLFIKIRGKVKIIIINFFVVMSDIPILC